MSFGKIDLNDGVVSPFFVIASGVSVELIEFSPFGLDFGNPLVTAGSGAMELSLAGIVAVLAVAIAYVTNQPDFSKLGAAET